MERLRSPDRARHVLPTAHRRVDFAVPVGQVALRTELPSSQVSVSWTNSAPHWPQVMVRTLMPQVYTTKDWTANRYD